MLKRGIDKRFGDVSVFKSRNSLDPAQLAGSDVLDCLKVVFCSFQSKIRVVDRKRAVKSSWVQPLFSFCSPIIHQTRMEFISFESVFFEIGRYLSIICRL